MEELINNCIKKDPRAEHALYKKCFQMLMRICIRYTKNEDDAADLLNQGFLKILNNLSKYDHGQPFDAWIKTIMVNTIIDAFRKNKKNRETFFSYSADDFMIHTQAFDSNYAVNKLSVEEIIAEVQKLPEPCLHVFNLYVFDGLNHKEIGEALKMPEGTSRWHLANARSILKRKLNRLFASVKLVML